MVEAKSVDTERLWQQAQENQERLNGCIRHRFVVTLPLRFGEKFTCAKCGGRMDGPRLYAYIQGYQAAGGNPGDIVENWTDGN